MYTIQNGVKLKEEDYYDGKLDHVTTYTYTDGVLTEAKYYDKDGKPRGATTYTFPEDPAIRSKLPSFTLSNYTPENNPSDSSESDTCEALTNSDTELIVRVKYYRNTQLREQYDITYKLFALPYTAPSN